MSNALPVVHSIDVLARAFETLLRAACHVEPHIDIGDKDDPFDMISRIYLYLTTCDPE